jgi:arylsulfatase A-like enzyme
MKSASRRDFIKIITAGSGALKAFLVSAFSADTNKRNPNIIIIYADDLGYGDCTVYNSKSRIPTPHIDQLAKEGVRFTDAHSPHATCTASRYGLLTGTSPMRTGVKNTILRHGPAIDKDEVTIAVFLKTRGYITKMVGKWHLGYNIDKSGMSITGGPLDHGFDYFMGSEKSYLDKNYIKGREVLPVKGDSKAMNRMLLDDVIKIIREHAASKQKNPLFLYYAPPIPHTPLIPEERFKGKSKAGDYGDYVVQLDNWVGKIAGALRETGLDKNTMLIFSSDNGAMKKSRKAAVDYPDHQPNWIFSGHKASSFEGGHRLPFIVRWPGVVPASTVSRALINHTDFFATLAEFFNVNLNKVYPGYIRDSYSFLSNLNNPASKHKRAPMYVMWSYRKEDWKLIINGKAETIDEDSIIGLYNLKDDISEQNDLSASAPEIRKQMFEEYKKFLSSRKLKQGAGGGKEKRKSKGKRKKK